MYFNNYDTFAIVTERYQYNFMYSFGDLECLFKFIQGQDRKEQRRKNKSLVISG